MADGTLALTSSKNGFREYPIPKLSHRELTGLGWQEIIYCLTIDDHAGPDDSRYVIESDSEYSGSDALLWSDDPDEIECWIQERVEGAED